MSDDKLYVVDVTLFKYGEYRVESNIYGSLKAAKTKLKKSQQSPFHLDVKLTTFGAVEEETLKTLTEEDKALLREVYAEYYKVAEQNPPVIRAAEYINPKYKDMRPGACFWADVILECPDCKARLKTYPGSMGSLVRCLCPKGSLMRVIEVIQPTEEDMIAKALKDRYVFLS